MTNNKNLLVVVFILFIIGLVYITVNKNTNDTADITSVGQQNNQNMPNIQQIEGVKITILKEGSGQVAKTGDMVAMNYTGKLTNGTVFDSNVDPKFQHVQPFVFTIGVGQVIKGWDVGIAGMKIGEQRILEIEPSYAYGETGAGGVIPPNATLIFDVELLSINK